MMMVSVVVALVPTSLQTHVVEATMGTTMRTTAVAETTMGTPMLETQHEDAGTTRVHIHSKPRCQIQYQS